jgi:hypothetical protein
MGNRFGGTRTGLGQPLLAGVATTGTAVAQ